MSLLELIVIIVIIIFVLWWLHKKRESFESSINSPIYYNDLPTSIQKNNKHQENWEEYLANQTLAPTDRARHRESMIKQQPIFSSGAGYSIVEPDNTSPTFTNFVGLHRPEYIPIGDGQRQVIDIDPDQLKKNKRAYNL